MEPWGKAKVWLFWLILNVYRYTCCILLFPNKFSIRHDHLVFEFNTFIWNWVILIWHSKKLATVEWYYGNVLLIIYAGNSYGENDNKPTKEQFNPGKIITRSSCRCSTPETSSRMETTSRPPFTDFCPHRLFWANRFFVFSFSLFFVSVPCARLSWPFRQLLTARKYIVSYSDN